MRAILFLLHDPVRELYPDCYEECAMLAERARSAGLRLVNPPHALSRSIKSIQAGIWRKAGVPTPPHFPFRNRKELLTVIDEVEFPALLRPDRLHAQQQMRFCRNPDDVRSLPEQKIPLPGTLTPFVDTREGYRRNDPDSTWARYYHKKRAMVFGTRVLTNHVFFSDHPIVGLRNSTIAFSRSFNPLTRLRGRRALPPEHIALDYDYWVREKEHEETLVRAARALELEFLAIDYSTHADGTPILWEANPHFAIHMWPLALLPRRRRLKERHRRLHDGLISFLQDLLSSGRSA